MLLPICVTLLAAALPSGPVVINEIHYDPPDVTVPEEFLELLNASGAPVDLSRWCLAGAVDFSFAPGTTIPAGEYLVVAQNVAAVQARAPQARVVGPFSGRLSNQGETLILRNALGLREDEVDYQRGFPWPTAGGAGGYSIELIHPSLDNSLGGSWRLSNPAAGQETELVAAGSLWRYFKGTQEPSNPREAWRELDFDDGQWLEGQASVGYGEAFIKTNLTDMQGAYSSVFLRKRFTVEDPTQVRAVVLEAQVDDGFNAWINGTHVDGANVPSDEMTFDALALTAPENQTFVPYRRDDPQSLLVAGENVLAIQMHNVSLAGSSDAFIDARLVAAPSGTGPTPGAINAVYAENAPPQLRQVEHFPRSPRSGEAVMISVKATDSDGVASVALEYQTVDPGAYIRLADPAYATSWTRVELRDDGAAPDASPGDGVFTAQLPGTIQTHRRLVRYRVEAADAKGLTARAPYADDPQPNFAYFVYNGVPGWRGASRPGTTPVLQFSAELMGSLPVYHLIAQEQDVLRSQYDSAYESAHFPGTFVYDGEVYDHMSFENRGEFSTYVSGKNKWRFHFRRGHEFQCRDNHGNKYRARWRTMNFSPCSTPWVPPNRGMAGLDESVAFRLYELAGVPSPHTNYLHFRVIDESTEAHATDQYRGDLWGLYITLEHTDGPFLEERGLPDGNTYKIEGGNGDPRNQGPTQIKGAADFDAFRNGFNGSQPITWWRANLDLDGFYSFRSVNRAINNMDLRDGWNYCQYHNPETGLWTPMPWDLDMLYMPVTHWSGVTNLQNSILQHATLMTEYRNRARELQDLLFTDDQAGQLVDELRAFVSRPDDTLTWAKVDEAMWNYHPRTSGSHRGAFYRNPSSQGFIGGTVNRTLTSPDHEGMGQWIKDFVLSEYGANFLASEANDAAIPARPTISFSGAAGFPSDDLSFEAGAFSDPQGAGTFGAMEWRIAEITPPDELLDPAIARRYEVEPSWRSPLLTTFDATLFVPADALRIGARHRARVRMRDTSGRWSRWSLPVAFTPGPPLSPFPPQQSLRVTEIHYHPQEEPDFEFIEVKNTGVEPLDLSRVAFRDGIEFSFAGSAVEGLAPGSLAVVVKDLRAFEAHYDTAGMAIAGEYSGSLSNSGERLWLVAGQNATILDFTFSQAWHPNTDGGGRSLSFVDPTLPVEAWSSGASWKESAEIGGSPGQDESGPPLPRQIPGDVTLDGFLDLSDAARILFHLFTGEFQPPCEGAAINAGGNLALADFDGNGTLEVTDVIACLSYLFREGPAHTLGTQCRAIAGCPEACGA